MDVIGLLPLVGIALVFWLLIIRPASRRNKEMRSMQSGLSVGDEVMLTSGFFGTVQDVVEDRLDIELAPGVVVTVAKGAIGNVVPPRADDAVEPSPHDDALDDRSSDPEER